MDAVRAALVNAAREMFVLCGVGKTVPETPSGQEWLSFGPPAQAEPKSKIKTKPKGRPKKEDSAGQQLPQELKGKLQKTCSFDEKAFDVTIAAEKMDDKKDKEFVSVPWADCTRSDLFFDQSLQRSLKATITTALRE